MEIDYKKTYTIQCNSVQERTELFDFFFNNNFVLFRQFSGFSHYKTGQLVNKTWVFDVYPFVNIKPSILSVEVESRLGVFNSIKLDRNIPFKDLVELVRYSNTYFNSIKLDKIWVAGKHYSVEKILNE